MQERSLAAFLEQIGHATIKNKMENVEGMGRQGDAFVSGLKIEFKTPIGKNGIVTKNTIKNVVNESIKGGGQAREIIVDLRGTGMTQTQALEGAFKALGIAGGKLDGLSILGDGYFFRYTPRE